MNRATKLSLYASIQILRTQVEMLRIAFDDLYVIEPGEGVPDSYAYMAARAAIEKAQRNG